MSTGWGIETCSENFWLPFFHQGKESDPDHSYIGVHCFVNIWNYCASVV